MRICRLLLGTPALPSMNAPRLVALLLIGSAAVQIKERQSLKRFSREAQDYRPLQKVALFAPALREGQ